MSQAVTAERIRLKCVQGVDTNASNEVASSTMTVPRAADVILELGLFFDASTIIDSFTDFVSLVIQVRDDGTRLTKILEYTVLKAAFNSLVITKANWDTGAQASSHVLQKIPGSDLNFDLSGQSDKRKSFFIVAYANWDDGGTARKTVMLRTQLTVEEYGIQDTLPALGGSAPNFVVRSDGTIAFKNLTATNTYRLWIDDADGIAKPVFELVS